VGFLVVRLRTPSGGRGNLARVPPPPRIPWRGGTVAAKSPPPLPAAMSLPPKPVELHVHEHGSGGRPVVLLHGFPFDGRMWEPVLRELAAAGHRAIAPDLRGFGRSPKAEPATMQAMAADVAHLIEARGLKGAVVVGFSMGGYVALQLAHRHRELLAGLVLVDTRAEEDTPAAREGRLATIEKVRAQGMRALVEQMMPSLVSPRTRASDPSVLLRLEHLIFEQSAEGAIPAIRGMMERPDMRGKLAGMNIPCLVACGADDAITPIDHSVRLAQAFRGSAFEAIPDAGHAAPVEQPARFSRLLLEWLRGL
jgi:3-oxoadipate enol-lactonase